MMMSRVVRFASVIVLASVAVACSDGPGSPISPSAAPALVATTDGPAAPRVASTAAPEKATAKYEQDFMMGMIDHHQMAIDMAEMCLEEAVHPELRSMCENIIATQSAEIQQMQSWLSDWYGVTYEPMMKAGMMRQMEKLAALSGEDFEIAFMEMMIRHHRAAVQEGQQCVRRAYHEALIEMCQNIITVQTAEIQQMEAWLCAWYDRC